MTYAALWRLAGTYFREPMLFRLSGAAPFDPLFFLQRSLKRVGETLAFPWRSKLIQQRQYINLNNFNSATDLLNFVSGRLANCDLFF
jgi:hypothetical protein